MTPIFLHIFRVFRKAHVTLFGIPAVFNHAGRFFYCWTRWPLIPPVMSRAKLTPTVRVGSYELRVSAGVARHEICKNKISRRTLETREKHLTMFQKVRWLSWLNLRQTRRKIQFNHFLWRSLRCPGALASNPRRKDFFQTISGHFQQDGRELCVFYVLSVFSCSYCNSVWSSWTGVCRLIRRSVWGENKKTKDRKGIFVFVSQNSENYSGIK